MPILLAEKRLLSGRNFHNAAASNIPRGTVCRGPPNPDRTSGSGNIDRNTRELGLTGLRGWLATRPRATDRSNLTG
jgi:hypothetical protein